MRYTYITTPLGKMIACEHDHLLVMLEFEDRRSLPKVLLSVSEHYAQPFIKGKSTLLDMVQQQLDEYFAGTRKDFDLPTSQFGTAFQQSVWTQLQQIPYGSTTTYGSIATTLGKPGAAIAVGSANGNNNLAIVIPCHRVIGEDGNLVGYAGGKTRKQKLLQLERDHSGQSHLVDFIS